MNIGGLDDKKVYKVLQRGFAVHFDSNTSLSLSSICSSVENLTGTVRLSFHSTILLKLA